VSARPFTLVAHRGAPWRAVENTLRSLQIADELGADAMEVDVRATRDGAAVLLHDATLERLWGLAQPVDSVDLADVRKLSARAPDGSVDRIPTLEEALDGTSRSALIIDCKAPAIIPAIAAMVRERGQQARTRFIGEPDMMEIVRRVVPDARIIMSWSTPDVPPDRLLERVRPFSINLKWTEENGAAAPMIAARGYEVWCYTIDDVATAQQVLAVGITGIITNQYTLLDSALRAGGE
jgi:glycerophosphoryl diester phosphodiesterase